MKKAIVLIIKFATGLVAFALGLNLFFKASIVDVVSFSVLVTVISYLVGDRILLKRLGKSNTIIIDFLLSYTLVWIFGSVVLDNYRQIAWGSIISATIITAGEIFIHRYMFRTLSEEQAELTRPIAANNLAYGMEIAEEQDPFKEK
ncbi:YndM family protein [Neobacillus sp. PS3-34]|uniref:YndM family protein n=1 Tax=Neobacillus sp. PS3-34 TaxID=3070678 RepID=UPI0027DF6F5D|nr:YndM family protein [Neobacillus sp. PS3-34]WML48755.1 YndM family protein [Neobacillus sp. PS3-34]